MRRLLIVLTACAACTHAPSPAHPDGAGGADAAGVTPDAGAGADAPAAPGDDPATWHDHADAALEAMLLHYWSQSAGYFDTAAYWTFAQAYDAVLDGVERTGGARFAGWVETLYLAQNAKGWSSNYYDDENWMTMALLRAYDLTKDARYLNEAKALYADIEAAWDTTCCGPTPGGIWWDRAHTQKATASNAGPVIAGVRLAARTGDTSYLTFAEQAYTYWRANMVDPATFQVFDDIHTDGTLKKYRFTYNEGLMIGAAVELHGATHDASYLADAHAIAGWMLAHETETSADGTILNDGTNTGCGGDCQQFKGIGFRYLSLLESVDPRADEQAVLASSAHAIWDLARGNGTLFAPDWAGPAVTTAPIINADSSATMALERYAESLGPDTATPAHHEAEEGVLHDLGIEATHAGFGGWGYVAGWNADGQWVDFHVHLAAPATHLVVRYAAVGDASRLIYIDGANAVANQALPSTGDWSSYQSVTVPVSLAAGDHTISVIYNSSLGSSGYLNLDWIDVTP